MQTLSKAESCVLVMNRPVAVCVKLVRKVSRLHAGCVSPEAGRLNKEQSIHSSVRWGCYGVKLASGYTNKEHQSGRQAGSDEHRSNNQAKAKRYTATHSSVSLGRSLKMESGHRVQQTLVPQKPWPRPRLYLRRSSRMTRRNGARASSGNQPVLWVADPSR